MKRKGKKSKAAGRANKFDRMWGMHLRLRREKCGLSIDEVARKSGVLAAHVLRSEEAPSRVSVAVLIRIFEVYGLSLSQALRPAKKSRD